MAQLDEKRSFMDLQKNGMNMKTNDTLIQSEQEVIGSLLRDNDSFDEVSDLNPESFIREDHQILCRTILNFISIGKPVDLILLAEELNRQGELDRVGGLQYIGAIVQGVNTAKNIKYHVEIVESAAKQRALQKLLTECGNDLENSIDPQLVAEKAEAGLFNLLESKSVSNMTHFGAAVAEAIDWEDAEKTGLMTGLRDLDRLTDGLNKSNLIIIAGRPSQGKSALAMQIAEFVSKRDPVAIFSLEMPKREVASRFIKFHESKVGKSQAISHLYSLKLHIDDTSGVSIQHIRSQCRVIKRKHGLSMIVIDYLQLMQGRGENRTQEIGAISRGLKGLAKEFDIPVVVLSQLSRKVEERADKRPVMSDLRDSGEIEQDADLILFIYRDETYNDMSDFKGLAEIICRKNRNGAIGDITTSFDGSVTRFGDYNGERILRVVKKQERGFTI